MSIFLDLKQAATESGFTLRWLRQRLEKDGVRVLDFSRGKQKRYRLLRSDFTRWMKGRP